MNNECQMVLFLCAFFDKELGQKVVDSDTRVNAMEVNIDETCTKLLARW